MFTDFRWFLPQRIAEMHCPSCITEISRRQERIPGLYWSLQVSTYYIVCRQAMSYKTIKGAYERHVFWISLHVCWWCELLSLVAMCVYWLNSYFPYEFTIDFQSFSGPGTDPTGFVPNKCKILWYIYIYMCPELRNGIRSLLWFELLPFFYLC